MSTTNADRVRGYCAAFKAIDEMLNTARKKRPKRFNLADKRLAAYRQGYFRGLLDASCLSAWGQFPNHPENVAEIQEVLDR